MKKTILITGSTDGIGKLAAIDLANDGHHMIVHGRSEEKLESTLAEIRAGTPDVHATGIIADLSDLAQIDRAVAQLKNQKIALDVLVNNAGVFLSQASKNKNGWDMRYVVNYIAPYYLTSLLIPLMGESADPRIINLSSAAQEKVSLAALKGEEEIGAQSAYAQSKLALTMWTFHLANKLPDMTIIPLNPGSLLDTKMVQEAYGRHWSPASKGAEIIKLLAIDEQYKNVPTGYFDNDQGNPIGRFGKAHGDAYDGALTAQLIEATEQILANFHK